jgi:hypothetical protein
MANANYRGTEVAPLIDDSSHLEESNDVECAIRAVSD